MCCIASIAKREGLGKVVINETLRLAPLALNIAEAILRGTLPQRLSRQLLLRNTVRLESTRDPFTVSEIILYQSATPELIQLMMIMALAR